jgi:DNA polymerase-3 subunit alpha
MSFFGTVAGVEESIYLSNVSTLDPREQLEWEKELIGLYVSSHPLSPYLNALRGKVTHFSSELGEAANKEPVTVAGLVSKMRTLTTKTGKPMAFVTIEDLQGPVELVIFPKIWSKCAGQIHMDGILLVQGKVDAESADPKILVDTVRALTDQDLADGASVDLPAYTPPTEYRPASAHHQAEDRRVVAPVVHPESDDDMPPMPPEPEDWHLNAPAGDDNSYLFATEMEVEISEPDLPFEEAVSISPVVEQVKPMPILEPVVEPAPKTTDNSPIGVMPPFMVNPRVYDQAATTNTHDSRMVTVILRSSGDKERDVRRLKRVHGLLRSTPGNDHFCFMIFENGHRHFLDFPNDTTGVNQALIGQLADLVGAENVQVETIKLQ